MKHFWLLFLILFSCQSYDEEQEADEQLPVSIITQIASVSTVVNPRYSLSDVSHATFCEGDCIGIFMDEKEVMKWTYGLTWSPEHPVNWPDKTTEISFQAYYPYASSQSVENVPMPSLSGQTGLLKELPSYDFMVASVTQNYGTDGNVKFVDDGKFKHVSCLVHLVFKEDEALKGAVLNKVSISGANVASPTTYSFRTRAVTLHPSVNGNDLLEATPRCSMNNASLYLIVNEKKSDTKVTLTLEYTIGQKQYKATKEDFAGNKFLSGVQQEYNMVVKDNQVVISDSSISDWISGGKMEDVILNGGEVK